MEKPLNRYVVWQIAISVLVLFVFILFEKHIPLLQQILVSGLILITLINCGAIMEQKIWVVYLEFCRLFLAGLSLVILYPAGWLVLLLIILLGLTYYYSRYLQSQYLRLVYTSAS